REALEDGDGVPALLEEEVADDLPGGPLAGGVGLVQVRLHPLELPVDIGPCRVGLGLQPGHRRRRHCRILLEVVWRRVYRNAARGDGVGEKETAPATPVRSAADAHRAGRAHTRPTRLRATRINFES